MTIPEVQELIANAARASGRSLADLRVLAVTKGQSAERVSTFLKDIEKAKFKVWALGESYLEEFQEKKIAIPQADWHFIGRLQSRKIPKICELASCVHAVSRVEELEVLQKQKNPPSFFVQINVSDEDSKNGILPADLENFLEEIEKKNMKVGLQGLMTLAAPLEDVGEKVLRSQFAKMRELRDRHLPQALLNMGMSGDFEIAISEGADVIRLGTLLLGERS